MSDVQYYVHLRKGESCPDCLKAECWILEWRKGWMGDGPVQHFYISNKPKVKKILKAAGVMRRIEWSRIFPESTYSPGEMNCTNVKWVAAYLEVISRKAA